MEFLSNVISCNFMHLIWNFYTQNENYIWLKNLRDWLPCFPKSGPVDMECPYKYSSVGICIRNVGQKSKEFFFFFKSKEIKLIKIN